MKKTFYAFVLTLFALPVFSQNLYDPAVITTIEITFPQSNWEAILKDSFAVGNGRLLGEAEINGTPFDSVGVRFRSPGTYKADNPKNALNIKLDYVKNQDFKGTEVLKLSNGAKDPSFVREVLSHEIAVKYMNAPRANYARVFVNGAYYGLFVHTESVNRNFMRENFLSDPDNPRFEGNPDYEFDPPAPPFGCTEGLGASLEYLGTGIACYWPHYDIQSDAGWDDLTNAALILRDKPENVRDVLDWDRFIWMAAFNNILVNLDSYLGAVPNNYHLFEQDNGRFAPVVDDLNESFGRYPWLEVPAAGAPQPALDEFVMLDPFWGQTDDRKPVLKAMFSDPLWRRMYVAHYRTILREVFDNGWYKTRAGELRALIASDLSQDPHALYSMDDFNANLNQSVPDSFDGATAFGVTELMDARVNYLWSIPELSATPPVISNPQNTPAFPAPGQQVTLTVSVSDNERVLMGYRTSLNEMFTLIEMADDGNHGDGAAGDGVFGAQVSVGVGGLQYYFYAENELVGVFDPALAERQYYTLGVSGDLVINELMADNETTQADQDGEFDDWLELFNNSNQTVDLSGWFLTDNPGDLAKWEFPAGVTIAPGEYLVVWADKDEDQSGLHASFKLSNEGESLLLVDPNLNIVDQVVFGPQSNDISFGRCPNGMGAFEFMPPTFAQNNDQVCATAVHDHPTATDYEVFPVPASDFLVVKTPRPEPVEAGLWSLTGQLWTQTTFTGETRLDLSGVPPGVYLLRLNGAVVEKIMVAR
ncbi:MAG: T9SS C-terminal target domain-containing protein [Bacteroidetes bacterium]|nr:MAG: T9SS C-terminal target domain-containing protein [Bacteroidota bacterium]